VKIICPISSDGKITKQTKRSLNALRGDYDIVYPSGYDVGVQMCSEIDLSITEHFFIDSDIEFSEDHITILRHSGCDVVSGAYKKSISHGRIAGNLSWLNSDERAFVAGKWGQQHGMIGSMVDGDCTALMLVDWCGTGFIYIKTMAIKKILDVCREPVFYHHTILDDSLSMGRGQTSADIGFCLNCEKAGIKIWLNCGVQVKHIRR